MTMFCTRSQYLLLSIATMRQCHIHAHRRNGIVKVIQKLSINISKWKQMEGEKVKDGAKRLAKCYI